MRGKIIKWDDEKGFGFIKSDEQAENVFAHISQFKAKHLRPAVGDVVDFELKSTRKGLQAVKIEYPNRPKQPLHDAKVQHTSGSPSLISTLIKLIVVCGIAFAGFQVYQKYQRDKTLNELSKPVYSNDAPQLTAPIATANTESTGKFKCDGRQYCSQMNSLEEARFFVKNCPDTKMDGNHDGEPCESDSRWH